MRTPVSSLLTFKGQIGNVSGQLPGAPGDPTGMHPTHFPPVGPIKARWGLPAPASLGSGFLESPPQ